MDDVTRSKTILKIDVIEQLKPEKEGMTLNEGYSYDVNGPLPQLADSIAKMAIQMDKDPDFGINGGDAFLMLIGQFYNSLKSEGGE